jgi:hypothetical protein
MENVTALRANDESLRHPGDQADGCVVGGFGKAVNTLTFTVKNSHLNSTDMTFQPPGILTPGLSQARTDRLGVGQRFTPQVMGWTPPDGICVPR